MKTFNSLEEMQPYYNKNTNTYEFIENQKIIDVEFNFDLNIDSNITARNIDARNIDARNITACNITAYNIKSWDITAWNIKATDINALNIKFYAVCFAYKTFVCNTIKGIRENAKYFCLDSDVVINKKED